MSAPARPCTMHNVHDCEGCRRYYERVDQQLLELEDCLTRITGGGEDTLRIVLQRLSRDGGFSIHKDELAMNLSTEFFRKQGGYR